MAVMFMKQKKIQIYDSLGTAADLHNTYLNHLLRYLNDEHEERNDTPLPDPKSWRLFKNITCTTKWYILLTLTLYLDSFHL